MAHPNDTKPLAALLEQIGVQPGEAGPVSITGESEALLPSPHRLAFASATAIAAQAASIAAIWKMRSGRSQSVSVDLRRATIGLEPGDFLQQNGHVIDSRAHAREPLNGFYPTRDKRWFWVVGTYPHLRNGALEILDCANSKDAVGRAVGARDAAELEETFYQRHMIGAMARTRKEWGSHPQGQWLAREPEIRIEKIADSAPEPFAPAPRPLFGLRVLDIAHVIAGPAAARTLAEQGADVLRVSSPKLPDPVNQIIETGTGKRSAYIDLTDANDRNRIRALLSKADVFVQSWRPGCMDRKGLSPADLAKLRPGIVYLSISCYGHGGPWADRGGFDQIGQTVTGVAMAEGRGEAPRLVPTVLLNDYTTAYLGTAGVLGALIARAKEGGSYHVSVSLCRSAMWVQNLGMMTPPEVTRPEPAAADLMTIPGPFGALTRVAPIAEYSETKACWTQPPEPLGASPPEWLPRA